MKECEILKKPSGNDGGKVKGKHFKNCLAAFDIETTRIKEIEQAVMYVWQFCIMFDEDRYITCFGRTWDGFRYFIGKINDCLGEKEKLLCFCHNLSYEWQFLKGQFDFTNDDIFAMDRRKILKISIDKIDIRCSYIQTNMSLAEFTHKYHVKHEKLKDFEYEGQRWPWTELTADEIAYMRNDVIGLCEAMYKQMQIDGDNLYTLPLTSTGYVRRDIKASMRPERMFIKSIQIDAAVYSIAREAFRGGDTHANRYYVNVILDNVHSVDRKSAYPAEQLLKLYPMSSWYKADNPTTDRLLELIYTRKRACLFRAAFTNIRLKNDLWGDPYIPRDKCRKLSGAANDNGRVLSAAYLEISLTDIDFKIINETYQFDNMMVLDLYHARYARLPRELTAVTMKYFKNKTLLQGDKNNAVYYMKEKNKLNSVYGCSVQDVAKQELVFNEDTLEIEYDNKTIDELLEKNTRNAYQVYTFGVFVTAWARWELFNGIKIAGTGFVYCDTDSVKFVGNADFSEYNRNIMKQSEKLGAYAVDRTGKRVYMGRFEYEGTYKRALFMGAKKYAVVNQDDEIEITIAGVNKRIGASEVKEAGGLEALLNEDQQPQFVFCKAGGLEAVYNDKPYGDYVIDGHKINIGTNTVLRPSTYTLSQTAEYIRLLSDPEIWLAPFNKDIVK